MIKEMAPETFNFDSLSHGQIKSKLWLCENLKKVGLPEPRKALFLGSWYGFLPFLMLTKGFFERTELILTDIDPEALRVSRRVLDFWYCEGRPIQFHQMDAYQMNYSAPPFEGTDLVFNTSCEHMDGVHWLSRIPAGTKVVLQGTDMVHPEHIFPFHNLGHFKSAMSSVEVQLADEMKFEYPDKSFTRFLVIGRKV